MSDVKGRSVISGIDVFTLVKISLDNLVLHNILQKRKIVPKITAKIA